ncbi:MAG: TraB/GumN family protein [Wenzhouxiangellaceae bacterium]
MLFAGVLVSGCAGLNGGYSGPPLWLLEHQGQRLWLFGTVHRLPEYSLEERVVARASATRLGNRLPPMPWRTIAVRKAMRRADVLLIEMLPLADEALLEAVARLAPAEASQAPLSDYLSAAQEEEVRNAAQLRGIDEAFLDRADPLLALSLFANTKPASERLPEPGADFWLMRDAQMQDMPIAGLEAVDDRLQILQQVLTQLQGSEQADIFLNFLATELSELSVYHPEYQELVRQWLDADLAALDQRMQRYAEVLPYIHQAFIAARNRLWVERLQTWLENDQDEFLAVGIGHLVGPDNLLQQLSQAGYDPVRIQ